MALNFLFASNNIWNYISNNICNIKAVIPAGSEEEAQILKRALVLLKELISSVDQEVLELDRNRRLQELQARLDPRAQAQLREGGIFRGGELLRRKLLHEGTLLWKVQGSRMKGTDQEALSGGYLLQCNSCYHIFSCLSPDVHVLLMSDILVFLQEKDQKFMFASLVSYTESHLS